MEAPIKKRAVKRKWEWAKPRQWIVAGALMVVVIAADQISKLLITTNIELHEWVKVIDPILYFTYAQNYQGIFSLNFGAPILYIILPVIAMAFVIFLLLRPQSMFFTVLMGLILGGGISNNLIDRIRLGYVVDWINMGLRKWRFWGTYNIADAAVVIAVILLVIYELFFSKKGTSDKEQQEHSARV